MGLLSKILGKQKREESKEAPKYKMVERYSSPKLKDKANHGGIVCGFDLSDEFYSADGAIRLTGTNWRKAMDDFYSLERFFYQACDYDKTFPKILKTTIYDSVFPSAKLNGPTPSGKASKYAMTVHFDAMEPYREPDDWDAWINAYAAGDKKTRESMDREISSQPFSTNSIIGTIGYLQSGAIGKADFHFWSGHICHTVQIRSKQGRLYLSKSVRRDAKKNKDVTTYQA